MRIVDALRRSTQSHGEVRNELGSLEWHDRGDVTDLFVTVTPGTDSTPVVVSADRSNARALAWVLSGIGSLIAAGIVGSVLDPSTFFGGAGIVVGMLGLGALTARAIWSSSTRRFRARMGEILAVARGEIAGTSEDR